MKRHMYLLFVYLLGVSLFSADFGLSVDVNTAFSHTAGAELAVPTVTPKASLWANTKLGGKFLLETDLSFMYNTAYQEGYERSFLLELEQLQISRRWFSGGESPMLFSMRVGRMFFSDFSAKVFAHKGDGLHLEWTVKPLTLTVFAAYTGLVQAPGNSMLGGGSGEETYGGFWGPMGAPRMVEGLRLRFPNLLGEQSLTISTLFQQDLRRFLDGSEEDLLDTQYWGMGMSGALTSSLSYNLYGYVNTGKQGADVLLGALAGLGVNYYMPTFLSSRVALEGFYASGDDAAFTPVSLIPASSLLTARQSNLAYLKGLYSMKPFIHTENRVFQHTLFVFQPGFYFRTSNAPLDAPATRTGASGYYLGSELSITMMARLFSDLGFSVNGAVYLPSEIMDEKNLQFRISSYVSFTM